MVDKNIPNAVKEYIDSFKYKIELHAHTKPASNCSELFPNEIISLLKSKNYDAVVITNHFYSGGSYMKYDDPVGKYLDDFNKTKEEGEKVGIKVLLGAEFRFNENVNDYLIYGVDEKYLRETVKHFDLSYCEFYEKFKRDDLLIVQAHPFRNGLTVQPADHMDGIVAFNLHPNHNSRVAKTSQFAIDNNIPYITLGTDLHHVGHEGTCALRTKVLPKDEKELVQIIKSKDYIFEIGGRPLIPYYNFD